MSDVSLDYLFQPKSIAIAGVSADPTMWNTGRRLMGLLLDSGFKGKIYPINPNGGEVSGLRIYPSIKDIPGTVDYVISAIPARYAPQLVADCATKGVRAIHFFTAGFSETGNDDGERLESEMLRVAHQNGIRVIGPNSMGLYCPRTGLSFGLNFPRQSGSLGLVSQSGAICIYGIREASRRGVHFSKVASYGNASDLNETDFLEYLTDDPETKIIAGYIEGVRNGSRFLRALKRATRVKPVITFKAGATEGGGRAATSHTGAIAGSNRIWESALKQAGAIQVQDVDELLDVALLFVLIAPPKGRNTAIFGMGGAASVLGADDCSNVGLTLPMLPAQVRQKLKDICTVEAGRFFQNPVDINVTTDSEMILRAVETIATCDEVDLLIVHMAFEAALMSTKEAFEPYIESVLRLGVVGKPLAVVLHSFATAEAKQLASEAYTRLCDAGFPVYPSFRRAASAISRFIEYHQWYQRSQDYDC